VSEALGLRVSIVVREVFLTLCAPVVCKLQDACLTEGPDGTTAFILRNVVVVIQLGQEIQRKLHFLEIQLPQHTHPENVCVEAQRLLRIFDPEHRMVQTES